MTFMCTVPVPHGNVVNVFIMTNNTNRSGVGEKDEKTELK